MHTSEKFATPLFVTATSNFPSLDINNIDAATMHYDINTLKKDFQQYRMDKEAEISDIKSLKQAIVDLTTMIKENPLLQFLMPHYLNIMMFLKLPMFHISTHFHKQVILLL